MVQRHLTVSEAYDALGLEQGAPLEAIKSKYKQLALRTHPDKNPGNEEATAQFQRVSEAYDVLSKHGHHPVPSTRYTSHPFAGYGAHDFEFYCSEDEDGYDYEGAEYDSYEDDLEGLAFYMFLFEELMKDRGRAHRTQRGYVRQRDNSGLSTEHIRYMREQQEAAEARRAKEAAERKAALEKQRLEEKRQAEQRQRVKASEKKAAAEAFRSSAERTARARQQKVQDLRSAVFSAARQGDNEKVKKGVWEDEVDAAGGEVRIGCESFVKSMPADKSETLLHIATRRGDAELVEWLDTHNADPEERDSHGFTAFHMALQAGDIRILKYFFEAYPPKDSDHKPIYDPPSSMSLLRLALDSKLPEAVWMVLDNKLSTSDEIEVCFDWIFSPAGQKAFALVEDNSRQNDEGITEEIINLLMSFGGLDRPLRAPASPSPPSLSKAERVSGAAEPSSAFSDNSRPSSDRPRAFYSGRGRGKRGQQPGVTPSPPRSPQESRQNAPFQDKAVVDFGARGRGRSRGWGRGRGRGRGVAPHASAI